MGQHMDANIFLQVVRPGLQAGDPARLAHDVSRHWSAQTICKLLEHSRSDVRQVAAVVLGLIGDMRCVHQLAKALSDADEEVNRMAEHGLWSIWFRSGDPKAACLFKQGMAMIGSENYPKALDYFKAVLRIDPDYAEAYNQCAIAHYFLDQWEPSLLCCKNAIRRVPVHFGAIAGMGHSYMQLGRLDDALFCYRKALRVNPRMPALADAVVRLERQIHDANDSSGTFWGSVIQV